MLFTPTFIIVTILVFGGLNSAYSKQPVCERDKDEPWTYRDFDDSYPIRNGPQYWGYRYFCCNGNLQSPIALNSSDAVEDPKLEKLTLNNYDQPISKGTIANNGHTVEVIPNDGIRRTMPVNGLVYALKEFHFHWGSTSSMGSEHTLDGVQYAMEMHLLHINDCNQYAVIAVLFQETDDYNEELHKIVDQFVGLDYKGYENELSSELNLTNLLPPDLGSYYRYEGSLTAPPCTQGVTWFVLPDPIPVAKDYIDVFRRAFYTVSEGENEEGCDLVDNFRPLQPLSGRLVSVPSKQ